MRGSILACALLGSVLGACSAQPKAGAPAASPQASSPAGYGQSGYAQPPGGTPSSQAQPGTPSPPPPPPEPGAASPAPTPMQPGGGAPGGTSRSMALQGATRDLDSSQRELDVAAGDCRNACRALGSMDRAAGKMCELAQGEGEGRRCDDAKTRVYSARDRVKTTCGSCPGGPSVDRTAPIPSVR
jgi:hypothetical protein